MNIIILSGGSGKRIWPLSNDVRSKQFIKVLKDDKGLYESMIQRIYKQIKKISDAANVTVATTEDQVPILSDQLDGEADISIEPCRRDTFPAIALTAAYMRDKKHIDEREPVIICPADSYVDADYFNHLVELYEFEQKTNCPICLIGIKPDSPSEKFGYIIPDSGDKISKVKEFKEKPSEQKAKEYIERGALWNGGVFACKIKYILDKAKDLLGTDDYEKMFAEYASFEKISFDYAIVEQEKDIQVMRYSGDWADLGTWQAFSEIIER